MTAQPQWIEAGPENVATLTPVFDAYRQFYEQATDTGLAERYLHDRLSHRESRIWFTVCEETQETLAFAQVYPTFCSVRADSVWVLYDLFVVPQARGRGLARRLLEHVHTMAALSEIREISLTTARTNSAAQALYESLGYRRDDVFLRYVRE